MARLNRTRLALGLLSLLLLAIGSVWWQDSFDPSSPAVSPPGHDPAFVPSMRGTEPDGDLRTLQGGTQTGEIGLPVYAELKRLFDYYLSAVGEQDIDAITSQTSAEIDRRLPLSQAPEAKRLLGLYLAFKRELAELEKRPNLSGPGVQAIRRRLLAMQDLRSQYFSAKETEGMFGFEDAYDMDAVARLEINQNPELNAAQKKEQVEMIEASMPAYLREDREASRVVVRIESQAQAMRASGASDDDIYRMRAKEFDPQAASRLAEVDKEELAWKIRIANYLDRRRDLLKTHANGTDTERQRALGELQESQFTSDERRRLAAYEQ